MLNHVSILIPYRPDDPSREKVFRWVLKFYHEMLPDVEICIDSCDTKLFSKSIAVNNAAKKATRDIFVIADADMIFDPRSIEESLQLLDKAPWVIPYIQVLDISQECTEKLLKTEPAWPIEMDLDVTKRNPRTAGGINIVPRKYFEAIGGWDERFVGWGGADDTFLFALDTICGRHKRLRRNIYHLWHKPLKAKSNPNYQYNYNLMKRYYLAYKNKNLMQQILNEKLRYNNNQEKN